MKAVIYHYDKLIEENNDPVRDPEPLKEYMDKWDGERFIESMQLDQSKSVLEIGVGTGRLAMKTAPLCKRFVGIDISPKTVLRASENLSMYSNVELVCGDFISHTFKERFDVIYSSLTFMHICEKSAAIQKVASLLSDGGLFVLSIDKNKSNIIDMGSRRIKIYPDDIKDIRKLVKEPALGFIDDCETEHACVIIIKILSLE